MDILRLQGLSCLQCSRKKGVQHLENIRWFLKGVFRLNPQLPRYTEVYDPDIILQFLETFPENKHLMLETLVKKLAKLSGQRGQTMPMLRLDCISHTADAYTFFIPKALKQTKPGHHQEPLRFERFKNEKLCVVNCLEEYLKKEHQRELGR